MGEFAIIGDELASLLVSEGFELVEMKEGNLCRVYYFNESIALLDAINKYMKDF